MSDVSLAHRIYLSGDLAWATHLLLRHLPAEEEDLRGFGWYYLWNVCQGQAVRAVPREGMVEVAFSPDGRTFATGGSNGMIRIWDRDTLMQKTELPFYPDPLDQYRSLDLLYSPSGDVLAALSRSRYEKDSGRVVLFDVDSGDSWPLAHGSPNNVVQMAFKEEGNTLITAERDGQVRLWNTSTGQPIGKPRQLNKGATWRRAAFSSDLRLLAAGGPKSTFEPLEANQLPDVLIKVYDLETGDPVSELQTDQSILGKLQFTQDSLYLINPGNPPYHSGKLVIWDIATELEVFFNPAVKCFAGVVSISNDQVAVGGQDFILFVNPAEETIVKRWDGVPGIVFDLALSPDGKQLASTGWDGMVRLWDLPRKENPKTVELDTPTTEYLSFSPDGDMLASAHPAGVVLRDAFSFKELYRLDGQTRPVFSPSGDRLATVSSDANDVSIHFWDCRSGQQIGAPLSLEGYTMESPRNSDTGQQLAFSTNGKLIGYAGAGDKLIILDVASARIHREFVIPSTLGRRYLAFGTNGEGQDLIAIPEGIRTVKLVNLDNDHEQILEGPTGHIRGVVFSPDGLRLVSSGHDIFVWNTNTGELELTIEENTSAVSQVAFSPDGTSILSRGWKGSLSLWDLQSGREKVRFLESFGEMPQSIAFSPDGNRIIASVKDGSLLVWWAPRVEIRSP
jgi:WD40 repeat protein